MCNWMDVPCTPIDPPPPPLHHPGAPNFNVHDLRAVLNHHFDCPWAAFNIVTLSWILYYSDRPSPSIPPTIDWLALTVHQANIVTEKKCAAIGFQSKSS